MEKITWKVDGMDCTNCALTIRKYLEKQGMQDVRVNFATGDVSFGAKEEFKAEKISKGISDLGYKVKSNVHGHAHDHEHACHLLQCLCCI
jgi:P-type Cu+ transporter